MRENHCLLVVSMAETVEKIVHRPKARTSACFWEDSQGCVPFWGGARSALPRSLAIAHRQPVISREREQALARRWREFGDASARDLLVRGHLRHVVAIARRYRRYNGATLEELIGEGNCSGVQCVGCRLRHLNPHLVQRFSVEQRRFGVPSAALRGGISPAHNASASARYRGRCWSRQTSCYSSWKE